MNFFEKLLEEKSKLNNSYDYFTQWNYDKELYKDILLGVRDYYSNYTDHGINHSETILTNILRMFGEEDLKNLSSFDIWLLLEAAYLHDCGMYISREEAEKTLKDEKFMKYLSEIFQINSHPMNKFAQTFKIENDKILYKDSIYNVNTEYNMRFIISSYKRISHAQDFNKVIAQKNKLLPERIYYILSIISSSHGENFESVINLPRKEVGINKEMGHPIFIACLLRMGDLLDIDNNRMSPSIINNLEDIMPEDSKLHLKKHRAITHFWIDREKIEITATISCEQESYEVAEITGKWFEYIEEEYNNQLYNWKTIIPNDFKGILPTLGELKIDIQNYEYINSKNKPKFSVDTNNILNLLVGTSIYEKKENAFREIIQNSIDATYLRVYEEEKNKNKFKKEFSIDNIKKLFEGKEIEVNIKKEYSDLEYNYWDITIKDKGIGIDKKTLKYIIEAGSSYKDKDKKELTKKMPKWLSPSGNFGIGFQSIFLLTDKVKIQSKSLYTQESIDVELIKPTPNKKNAGNIYFRKTKFDYNQEIGTIINFEYKTKKVSNSYIMEGKNLLKYLNNFDPLFEEEFDTEIYQVVDEIENINSYSFLRIFLKKDNVEIDLSSKIENLSNSLLLSDSNYQVYIEDFNDKGINYYYKNQLISNNKRERDIKFLTGIVNILGYSANEVLELNRNKIKDKFFRKNYKELFKIIYKEVEKRYLKKFKNFDDELKLKICFYYFYYKKYLKKIFENTSEHKKLVEEYEEELQNFYYNKVLIGEETINSLIARDKIKITIIKEDYNYIYEIEEKIISESLLEVIFIELHKNNKYCISIQDEGNKQNIIFSKSEKNYNILEIPYNFKNFKRLLEFSRKRFYIYCNEKSSQLKLRNNGFISTKVQKWIFYNDIFQINYRGDRILDRFIEENLVLFPFFVKNDKSLIWNDKIREEYIKFCYQNRAEENKNLTQEEFGEALDNFINYLKEELEKEKIKVQTK